MSEGINTKNWWENYFQNHWENNNGREQTAGFIGELISNLPNRVKSVIKERSKTIVDWGCALGDGTSLLNSEFPEQQVVGVDIADEARKKAKNNFPELTFYSDFEKIPFSTDVVVNSNCLEHFTDYLDILKRGLSKTTQLYIIMVPHNETPPLCESHFHQLLDGSFPDEIVGFQKLYSKVITSNPEHWNGEQLIVLYGRKEFIEESGLTKESLLESAKWDDIYENMSLDKDEFAFNLGAELKDIFLNQLSLANASILEAGCGGGQQSLALAAERDFQVSLLDFSENALNYAKTLFEHFDAPLAELLCDDVFVSREPNYQMVFNAGVLEHYSFEKQVDFLKGMSSRSSKYVLVLVPNYECYWYWAWRLKAGSIGHWEFGKEIPELDMKSAFEAAGIKYTNKFYLGKKWTESFVEYLTPENLDIFKTIHDLNVVSESCSSYLVGFLGEVALSTPKNIEIEQLPDRTKEQLSSAVVDLSSQVIVLQNKISKLELKTNDCYELNINEPQFNQTLQSLNEKNESVIDSLYEYQKASCSEFQKLQEVSALHNELLLNIQTNQKIYNDIAVNHAKSYLNKSLEPLHLNNQFLLEQLEKNEQEIKLINIKLEKSKFENSILEKKMNKHVVDSIFREIQQMLLRIKNFFSSKKILNTDEKVNHEAQNSPEKGLLSDYRKNQLAQKDYVTAYCLAPCKTARQKVLQWHLENVRETKGVVIMPIAYDLSIKQRPDHIARVLSENGFVCLMVEISSSEKHFNKIDNNVFVTNYFEDVIAFYQSRNAFLYITYPLFSYISEVMDTSTVIYDVLDDLTVFNGDLDSLTVDHDLLIERAEFVLYSSETLKKSCGVNENMYLVRNGVFVEDFVGGNKEVFCEKFSLDLVDLKGKQIIGYHGAISELIDFNILTDILNELDVILVLVGPVTSFDSEKLDYVITQVEKLKKKDNCIVTGLMDYKELKHYLSVIDLGVVPFIINEKTAHVSPLKLFEYLAADVPVLSTPTETVKMYGEAVNIADEQGFTSKAKELLLKPSQTNVDWLKKHEWTEILSDVITDISKASISKKYTTNSKVLNKTVDIINVNFFDWDGEVVYKGGAERYVYDLAVLVNNLGGTARILQNSNKEWVKTFKGVQIVGTGSSHDFNMDQLSSHYNELCKNADLIICSPAELASQLSANHNVISINHGIHWDHKFVSYNSPLSKDLIINALKNTDICVCVDTNFINWTRTVDYELSTRLKYIPNYVDIEQFKYEKKNFKENTLKILYPRRLYEARGIWLVLEVFEYLFDNDFKVELLLCGQASDDDTPKIKEFQEKYSDRVKWFEYDMEDMHKAYIDSHIALVPTVNSEGTSLSCLEAMASNNAIISTDIGGLPNLILNDFNGLLISPNSNELLEAILKLLNDRDLCSQLAQNAYSVSKTFNKGKWLTEWQKYIEQTLS